MNQEKLVWNILFWCTIMHSYNHLWISVCDFQNESKLNHVFLLVWIAALLHNHSQSSRANRSVWNLALIWHRLTFPMENSPNRCLAKRASSQGSGDSRQMLRKCVWGATVTWTRGQRNLFSPWILFLGPRAASKTEVALCRLWMLDPLRCVHVSWTSARKKVGGRRPGGRRGKALVNQERWKSILLWLHICGERGQTFFQLCLNPADF